MEKIKIDIQLDNNNIYFDSIDELKKMSINLLFVLQKRCVQLLEHYIVNDLYDKNDYINVITDIYKINVMIDKKLKKGV